MRLQTFSVLKNCKYKALVYQFTKKFLSSDASKPKVSLDTVRYQDYGDSLVEVCPSWPPDELSDVRAAALASMQVFPDFITIEEEKALLEEVEPILRRMRYEYDHWDNAIEGYRETERAEWRERTAGVLRRVRAAAERAAGVAAGASRWLDHTHVLDLAAAGYIRPHVDNVRFCGDVIAGVCLLSGAVMRLQLERRPPCALLALLPPRCLYVMSGVSRYEFSHAVLGNAESQFRGVTVPRSRRVSLVSRTAPPPDPSRDEPPAVTRMADTEDSYLTKWKKKLKRKAKERASSGREPPPPVHPFQYQDPLTQGTMPYVRPAFQSDSSAHQPATHHSATHDSATQTDGPDQAETDSTTKEAATSTESEDTSKEASSPSDAPATSDGGSSGDSSSGK